MHRELQDDERKAFEAYLLAGDDQDLIQKALTHLVPGSVPHNYLYFVNLLSKAKEGVNKPDDQEIFNKFVEGKHHRHTSEAQQIKLWNLLRSFDNAEKDKRQEILDELCKYLKLKFDDKKPQLREGIRNDESSEDEHESRSTLSPEFYNITNQKIIEKKFKKLEQRLEKIKAQQKETTQAVRERRNEIKQFLNKIAHKGEGIWHELDFQKFDADAVYESALDKVQLLSSIQNVSFFSSIVKGIQIMRNENPYFELRSSFVQSFTIPQLDQLKNLDKWFETENNFIGAYFQKQFCEELSQENQEIWTSQEKLQNLERLYGLAKSQNLPKDFQRQFLNELLVLGPKIGIYSKQYFRDYINLTEKHEAEIFINYDKFLEEMRKPDYKHKAQTNWNQYCQNVTRNTTHSDAQQLINKYLDYFCEKQNADLTEFSKDFKATSLQMIERKWKVYLSRDGIKSLDQDQISLDFYKNKAGEVILEFSEQNKENFGVNEDVSLEVIIKNIKLLHVKVFEFNTETYYKKNLQPFNTAVNLDGLDASESNSYTYDLSDNIRHRETFQFALNNRVGLFIVELMGNGYSARAVIKKGSLSLVHRSTVAGHLAYVLDHNKEVCIGRRTGVWFDQKYYPSDLDTGRIFMPYSKQELSAKIIMIHEDFAQLTEFTRKTENFSFDAQFYLHSGSILVGQATNIVIKAKLNINGRKTSLSLLKNIKIVITTENYIDNFPVVKNFENLQFDNDKELNVTFQVPPNLSSCNVNLTCEVLNATTKKIEKFSKSQNYSVLSDVKMPSKNSIMCVPYLRKVNGEYEVSYLGRNGEPAAKKSINVSLKHRLKNHKNLQQTLMTSKYGTIKLGNLNDIQELSVSVKNDPLESYLKGCWKLDHSNGAQYWSYPRGSIELLEGDSLQLPINLPPGQKSLERKRFSLIHSNNDLLIDDWFDQVKLFHSGDELTGYQFIQINNLSQGNYSLNFVSGYNNFSFNIKVHKGKSWGQDGFILKKSCLQENVQSSSFCKILNVKISDNKKQVDVCVENVNGNVHLHAFAHQYLPRNQLEFANKLNDMQAQQINTSSFPFAQWQNMYQSNRKMADEIRYVFDRKQLDSQLGNTLERPTLLNKRNFVQNTNVDAEVVNEGAEYKQMPEMMMQQQMAPASYDYLAQHIQPQYQQQRMAPQAHYMMQNIAAPASYNMANFGAPPTPQYSRDEGFYGLREGNRPQPPQPNFDDSNVHSELQSFMKFAPLQKLNISPIKVEDDKAYFSFTCDLDQYSQLSLITVDKDSTAQRSVDIKQSAVIKKDLRLLQLPNQDQGLTESRSTTVLLENNTHLIQDISSTDLLLLDDLQKMNKILNQIRTMTGQQNQFEVFDFIFKWHTLSNTQKDTYYSDYCCHELNFFIYKKDQSYFKKTVQPFIMSKMEKQFMDLYLLSHTVELLKFTQIHLIQTLNVLEKCLLIEVLVQQKQTPNKETVKPKQIKCQNDHLLNLYNKPVQRGKAQSGEQLKCDSCFERIIIAGGYYHCGKGCDFDLCPQCCQAPNQQSYIDIAINIAKAMSLQLNANTQKNQDTANYNDKIIDIVLSMDSLNQDKNALSALKKNMETKIEKQKEILMQKNEMIQLDYDDEDSGCDGSMLQDYELRSSAPMERSSNMVMSSNFSKKKQSAPRGRQMTKLSAAIRFDDDEDYAMNERKKVVKKQNFDELESTNEYAETHYYKETDNKNAKNLVSLNQFWCDFADHLSKGSRVNFLSSQFTDCAQSDRESFFALCVTDMLMVANQQHDFKSDEGRGIMIHTASNCILFKKEIRACEVDLARNDIMVIHRYNETNGNQNDNQQSGNPQEFLARTPYSCEVVITNVAPKAKSFNLLYQVPQGSIPLQLTKYVKSQYVSLQPYVSQKVVFTFYFPSAGDFKHFPSNISTNGKVTARGGANDIKVVDSKRINKINSFDDILHAGNKEDVLNFLKSENLYNSKMNFDFNKMLYLLKDKQFFEQTIEILRDRCIFVESVWKYSLYHKNDDSLISEFLNMDKNLLLYPNIGSYFKSGLIEVTENSYGNYWLTNHLEYHPMVNSRTHLLGQSHKILNATFRKTYDKFLATTIQKPKLTQEDKMILVYYLQLQDRIQEAIELFKSIQVPNSSLRIQYDYLLAYFDFFNGSDDGFKVARRIVQKYDNYPVSSWRMMFLTIADQLNEFDGEFDNEEEMLSVDAGASQIDVQIRDKRAQNKKEAKKKQPQMNIEVDAKGTLKIESVNVSNISIKYYIINAELLFSRQPFLKDNTEGFSYVKAYHSLEYTMQKPDATEEQLNQYVKAEIALSERLFNQNMVIEITSGDLQKFLTYYSNELKVNVLEQYGELKVTHATSLQALPRTYVKVFYQKKQGGEAFYRDGYTDIRGKIEYAQTSGDKLKEVKRFAILIQNDKYGSKILECAPPKEVQGNNQEVSMATQKMERLQNRQMYAKTHKK